MQLSFAEPTPEDEIDKATSHHKSVSLPIRRQTRVSTLRCLSQHAPPNPKIGQLYYRFGNKSLTPTRFIQPTQGGSGRTPHAGTASID